MKIVYRIKNEFNVVNTMTESELKLLFNKKLLKIIFLIEEKDWIEFNLVNLSIDLFKSVGEFDLIWRK